MSDPDRPALLDELTRWNRAGLSRFTYVDGDAATWLEELRIAAMGLLARGAPIEERLPETWRYRFSTDPGDWPGADERQQFADALAWQTLARPWPETTETPRRRNARLIDQYGSVRGDYAWELMRAAARAAHVLLGYLDAYANEGYLRTATQWSNLARLAATVNYQPAPPTSAVTSVGLIVDPSDDGAAIEIEKGLAMKFAAPTGGSPIIFETLERIAAHSDLNALRPAGWDCDPTPLATPDVWIDDPKADLAPGSIGVVTTSDGSVGAIVIASAERDPKAGTALIAFTETKTWQRGKLGLRVDPMTVRKGLPRSTPGVVVLKIDTASNYPIDSIIRLHYGSQSTELRISGNSDGHLKLDWSDAPGFKTGDPVTVETLVPVVGTGAGTLASPELGKTAYYYTGTPGSQVLSGQGTETPADKDQPSKGILGIDFAAITAAVGFLYAPTKGAKSEAATVASAPKAIVPGSSAVQRVVSFAGKPPKGLSIGDVMVRRPLSGGAGQGLTVAGVATNEDSYSIEFGQDMPDGSGFEPDLHEFHGPLIRTLRPFDYDRNPGSAFADRVIEVKSPSAKALEQLRIGRKVLVEDELDSVPPVLAVLAEAQFAGDDVKLILEPAEGLAGFRSGWTLLNLNTVTAGHGETKSPKVLGSGDGERALQSFAFPVRDVSFLPSSLAEAGVAPALEITVNGELWTYRDLIDPTADGAQAWSSSLVEDGTLLIHFRRRLPTGTDNVAVRQYRVGVGPSGSVPARAFTKPMKKDRWVRALTQPLEATGGASREPIEDIRVNAPARLASNGRAVSIGDFERLCRRRSDIWQARAYRITDPSRSESVGIILVPANGGSIGATLEAELTSFVEGRALPGVRVSLEPFVPIRLIVEARVRVDIEAFDRNAVQAAAQAALVDTFSLRQRALGQPAYIAEVSAALERVEGVSTATVKTFAVSDESLILRTAMTGSAKSAYFPRQNQVIAVSPATAGADMAVKVEAL